MRETTHYSLNDDQINMVFYFFAQVKGIKLNKGMYKIYLVAFMRIFRRIIQKF